MTYPTVLRKHRKIIIDKKVPFMVGKKWTVRGNLHRNSSKTNPTSWYVELNFLTFFEITFRNKKGLLKIGIPPIFSKSVAMRKVDQETKWRCEAACKSARDLQCVPGRNIFLEDSIGWYSFILTNVF